MDFFSSRLRTALTTSACLVLMAPAAFAAGMQLSEVDQLPAPSAPISLASDSADEVWTVQASLRHDLAHVVYAAVAAEGGVPVGRGRSCPTSRLRLSWTDPGKGFKTGAFISPLGPAPTASTEKVNGVVLCAGSHEAFLGFDAVRTAAGWDVEITPDPAGGVDDDEQPGANHPDTAPRPKPAPKKAASALTGAASGAAIEGFARYEGQSTCSPGAKPGTLALRNLLLARYPSTGSSGISRGCGVGGRSEHKEGRAFDWSASIGSDADRAAVQDFLNLVMATDSHGNKDALVRRMGIMYVIWNHQIWSAYRAGAGWRPYTGSSPHTDHVHISLSWAGALAKTSFWSGTVVEGLSSIPTGGGESGGVSNASYRTGTRSTKHQPTTTARRHDWPDRARTSEWAEQRKQREAELQRRRAAREAELAKQREERARQREEWRKQRDADRDRARASAPSVSDGPFHQGETSSTRDRSGSGGSPTGHAGTSWHR
jgi:hypothetical protein